MIVIVSWYSDGSGEPKVSFEKITYQERKGFFGIRSLIESIRDTEHKQCRAWEVWGEDFELVYDSTDKTQKGEL